ncbi:MAG: alanine--tRNA ligase, partial [Patescibacteria group bacterium]|nr:alanine--tRNA ligase [Patescibacteria group bacterium]
KEKIPVSFVFLDKEKAYKIDAKSFFREKYPEKVKIYYIGQSLETAYSKEFCGGPHVKNTQEIGKIKIYKWEKIGTNIYRIYAK